jgi:thiamine pyrophosphate-dependent acetolactate synthase large subunit-like protein
VQHDRGPAASSAEACHDLVVVAPDVLERRGRVRVLVGPGVVDAGAVEELRAFAAAGNLGVANTWGAKGVFAWDSPHHLGTCGLQARDFELLGFADADLIVAVGLDEDESPRARVALAPLIELDPSDLSRAVGRVVAAGAPLPNDLYPRLAAVAQPGFVDEKVPLHPARAVADLGAVLPPGGFLSAEPGLAGLWVARTFPTPALMPGEPRRVVVPARRDPGIALGMAIGQARARRPSIAVVASPQDASVTAELDALGGERLALVVVRWDATAGAFDHAGEHRERVAAALAAARPTVVDVPVCLEDTRQLTTAAGEVVAWNGLTSAEAEEVAGSE